MSDAQHDLPPGEIVYQQSARWLTAGVLETMAHDRRRLEVIKLPAAKREFVLLAQRWVVERNFGWASRSRQLARDDKRLLDRLAGLHLVAFTGRMVHQLLSVAAQSL
jgi:transposase